MLNLQKRIRVSSSSSETSSSANRSVNGRLSIRDRLLTQEVLELETILAKVPTCRVHFPSPSILHHFQLTVSPSEGFYQHGNFTFAITVPPEYNNVPPAVRCLTRIWHPNINEDGGVCLSLLRQASLDGYGWLPTRRLSDVVLGLNSLFTDLIDFDDALNAQAAIMWRTNRTQFERKVADYIRLYCK